MNTMKEVKASISNVRIELSQLLFTLNYATPKGMPGKVLRRKFDNVKKYRDELEELIFAIEWLDGDLKIVYSKEEYDQWVNQKVDDANVSINGEFCKLVECMCFDENDFWLIYLANVETL